MQFAARASQRHRPGAHARTNWRLTERPRTSMARDIDGSRLPAAPTMANTTDKDVCIHISIFLRGTSIEDVAGKTLLREIHGLTPFLHERKLHERKPAAPLE